MFKRSNHSHIQAYNAPKHPNMQTIKHSNSQTWNIFMHAASQAFKTVNRSNIQAIQRFKPSSIQNINTFQHATHSSIQSLNAFKHPLTFKYASIQTFKHTNLQSGRLAPTKTYDTYATVQDFVAQDEWIPTHRFWEPRSAQVRWEISSVTLRKAARHAILGFETLVLCYGSWPILQRLRVFQQTKCGQHAADCRRHRLWCRSSHRSEGDWTSLQLRRGAIKQHSNLQNQKYAVTRTP